MKSILITLTLISIHAAVFAGKIKGDISPIFDLSPDGEKIVIAIYDGESSLLYEYSLKGKSMVQLTDNKNEYHVRPVYSPKGDKIMFLSKSSEKQQSDICLLDIASKKITKVTTGDTYVTEATFSPAGDKIIFCGAAFLGNYSPVARKAPHDLDLFSIGTDGKGLKKLTDLSAYELSSVSLNRTGDSALCQLTEKGFEGIYLVSLADGQVGQKIEALNNPRPAIGNSFYSNPIYAPDFKSIAFTAPYQLYTLDLEKKECKEVWSTFGKEEQAMVILSRFYKGGDKLIFSILKIENRQYASSAKLMTIDLKTKELTEMEIQ